MRDCCCDPRPHYTFGVDGPSNPASGQRFNSSEVSDLKPTSC